jgi:capsular polysaccharide biosynthesis protein
MGADLDRLKTKRTVLASGLFDAEYYRHAYPDIRSSPIDPLTHYLTQGEAEGRSPNPVFLPAYYRRQSMALAPAEWNALAHYAEVGERLGHQPHPAFDPQAYLAAHQGLADFVDRPLFHYLKIGRDAGLPVALGPHGEALARVLQAQTHARDFTASGRRNHHALMLYKEAVVRELGVAEGFAFYRQVVDLPDSARIQRKPIAGLYDVAKGRAAAFHEIAPAGELFVIPPPRVVGEGRPEQITGATRAIFVACLIDARVRGRSGVIETADLALFDWQGDERSPSEEEHNLDPAVFHAEGEAVWIMGPDEATDPIELDEAFMLLGPRSDDFRHWMLDLLPRYLAASASGALPPVPVLIDDDLPARQRECLELMLPAGVDIVPLGSFASARVRRLWCAPSQLYVPLSARRSVQHKWDYLGAPPERFAALAAEMVRRVEPVAITPTGQQRVYLAGNPAARQLLVNSAEIEAAAKARGFAVVHAEDLGFAEQVRLFRHARFVIAQAIPDLLLALFARPGTRLCYLSDPYPSELVPLTAALERIGIDVTVLTGAYARAGTLHVGTLGYRIDPKPFGEFVDRWAEPDARVAS